MGRKKLIPLKKLRNKADKICSKAIRERDGHKCFTCGVQLTEKTSQNGHYISRSYLRTRFHPKNCHCQCAGCNIFRHGNMDEYAIKLRMLYGENILEELSEKKRTPVTDSRDLYNRAIEYYTKEYKRLSKGNEILLVI